MANFRAPGRCGGGVGGGGIFPGITFDQFKTFKINPEIAKLAPKFTPIVAANEAELVKKLNEMIADKDFLTKNGIDIAKLEAAARKVYAGKKEIIDATTRSRSSSRGGPEPDSTEAKGR